MPDLLFYDKPIALNKIEHASTRIKPSSDDFSFAARTNSVILAGVEFTEAAKEYPVVFAQAGEKVVPIALLGLRNEENLYVNEGQWDARYVPAFVRRYPFVLAETGEEGQRIVCIDESYKGFSTEEGEPLFANDEPTPLLQRAIDFLEEYQKQYLRTEQFVKRLQEYDLLVTLNAKVDMPDGEQFSLNGLLAVDEQKMLQLSDEKALELYRSGELAWMYCHLMSLGSMSVLAEKITKKNSAIVETANTAEEATKKPDSKKGSKKVSSKKTGAKKAGSKKVEAKNDSDKQKD